MEKGKFGERLKREREMRGVTLEEISTATRIGKRFLEALENERWEQLPGGIFNRGFVRAMAGFLGLDEETMVAEYAAATNDLPAFAVSTKDPSRSHRRLWAWMIVLAVAAALVAAGWLTYRRYGAAQHHPVQGGAMAHSRPSGGPGAASGLPPAAPAAAATPATAATSNSPAPPMKLQIEAGRTTHVRVTADGKTVFDGELKPGESRVFDAGEEFQVSAADSSAVLLKLNGHNLPPLGPPDQPGSATFGRKELRRVEGGLM